MQLNRYTWTREKLNNIRERRIRSDAEILRWGRIRVHDGRIIHTSNVHGETGLVREIVAIEDRNEVLLREYKNPAMSRNGRDSFYDKLSRKYIGISRRDVINFLRQQPGYQQVQPIKRTVSAPIIAAAANERWQMDLIDMQGLKGHNGQYAWILTIVDCFSKFAWTRPVFMKSARHVATALKSVLENVRPKIIQSDNGPEFVNREMKSLLESCRIEHVRSATYSPQANGQIERFNRTLKSMIWAQFKLHNTKNWRGILDVVTENYNDSRHSTTHQTPKETIAGKAPRRVSERIRAKAAASLSEEPDDLKRGDKVRVVVLSEAPDRKNEKSGFRKHYIKNYSKTIYTVESVSRPRTAIRNIQYKITNAEKDKHLDRIFYRRDLLKII